MLNQHFVTGLFQSHAKRLPDSLWGDVQDSVVIVTSDTIVLCEGNILLGKRKIEPAKGLWWIFGGKILPGESIEESAARNLQRELGLAIDDSRFIPLGTWCSVVWSRREQPPQDHGVHNVILPTFLALAPAEKDSIRLDKDHSELQWIKPQDLLKRTLEFHEALLAIVKEFSRSSPLS